MTRFRNLMGALALGVAVPALAIGFAAPTQAAPADPAAMGEFFKQWRAFEQPEVKNGVADYGTAAMAREQAALPAWQARLAAMDRSGWPVAATIDYRLIEAEMNGLDFNFRVLKPWARDPGFYANIANDWSDVPAHEGQTAYPNIDLYAFKWPLNAADSTQLTMLLAAVPANLAAARINLAGSNARDLWVYGDRSFKEQADMLATLGAGKLLMNTLDGRKLADMKGATPALRRAIADAEVAMRGFAGWIAAEAPGKTGPSGVGKENYNWHAKYVELNPWDWDAQVVLLQRELDRSLTGLRLEEARNRALPPITPMGDPAAFAAALKVKQARFSAFLAATGLAEDSDWARAAIANQSMEYTPPGDRNFFTHVTAEDQWPLMSHFTHWIDLARMREAPQASPVRRVPPLYNIYANRSEGFATAFEEIVMQAGLYDDVPRGRELVWIMLANRAARGLASLHVQANEMDLAEAGKFHASWTPRGWSDAASPLVGFEQLIYLRQPGYGPSYIVGKLQLEHIIADESHAADLAGKPFVLRDVMHRIMASGIIPVALIGEEIDATR
jgi:hypothetical protein